MCYYSHFTGGDSEALRLFDLPQATQQIHARPRIKIQQHLTSVQILKPLSLLLLEHTLVYLPIFTRSPDEHSQQTTVCHCVVQGCAHIPRTYTSNEDTGKNMSVWRNLPRILKEDLHSKLSTVIYCLLEIYNFKQSSKFSVVVYFVLCQHTERTLFKSVFSCPFAF